MAEKADKTWGHLKGLMLKLAEHPTDAKLEEAEVAQPEPAGEDSVVEDIGAPAVQAGKVEKPVPASPAAVSEEPSIDYTATETLPTESPEHPTNKELREEPAKAAATYNSLVAQGKDLEKSLGELVTLLSKDEAPVKQAQAKTPAASRVPAAPKAAAQEKEADFDPVKAGHEAAATVATAMLEDQAATMRLEVEKFAQMGLEDSAGLTDALDMNLAGTLGGVPGAEGAIIPEEAGAAAPAETSISLEELRALAEALKGGKAPETPEEREILDLLKALGVQIGETEVAEGEAVAGGGLTDAAPASDILAVDEAKTAARKPDIRSVAEAFGKLEPGQQMSVLAQTLAAQEAR